MVADTSFLVNFLMLDRMDILRGLQAYAFHVSNHVVAEVEYEDQHERLAAAIHEGILTELEIIEMPEIVLYSELRQFLGDGESACLAIAASRRWMIATDEKRRLRREVLQRLGQEYLLTTPTAIVGAIQAGLLTISEANGIRDELGKRRFIMDAPAFEDLLREDTC